MVSSKPAGHEPITALHQVSMIVSAVHDPQFILPERFVHASFSNFEINPNVPQQPGIVETLRSIVDPPRSGMRFWERRRNAQEQSSLYIAGPPGVGKTHLLASAYSEANEPKLYATFDEFMAAAGVMGMRGLGSYLSANTLVCVDEIDLDDPASIMLLTSLLGIMLDAGTKIIATANASPQLMSSKERNTEVFHRELGVIASAFELVWLDGSDWRLRPGNEERRSIEDYDESKCLQLSWTTLSDLLQSTHPMYDAAWLKQTEVIVLDKLGAHADVDHAIRFVRFIDRVYDRNVALYVRNEPPPPEVVLEPISRDGRYALHYARCRSRLIALLGYGDQTGLKSAKESVVN